MTASAEPRRRQITSDWTLGELKESFPGVEMAMFAFFGVGSRERSGFSASERLDNLLRRHLIFDTERACARLDALAEEDWRYQLSPSMMSSSLRSGGLVVVDVRGPQEHEWCALPGSQLLSAQVVADLRVAPPPSVVTVCGDGSQAPAASRHLRGLGLSATHLAGGLRAWSQCIDSDFPILFPLLEQPGCWHLLADAQTLRYRRPTPLEGNDWRLWSRAAMSQHSELAGVLESLTTLQMVVVTPQSVAIRGEFDELGPVVTAFRPWLERDDLWLGGGGESSSREREEELLARVLAEEAPAILGNHKGTVEVESYSEQRQLVLRLGGGCAGCASAEITTQRELAAALYRQVPLLDSILSYS